METYDYQTLRIRPDRNEVTFGSTTQISKIEEEHEFSFKKITIMENNEELPIYELVSPFGSEEYYCTGTCYCGGEEDEDEMTNRRNLGSNILTSTRGVIYLVSAVSALVALDLATDYFEEECEEVFSEECGNSGFSIHSSVEKCESIFSKSKDHEITEIEKIDFDAMPISERSKLPKKKYWCKGSCVLNSLFRYRLQRIKKMSNDRVGEFKNPFAHLSWRRFWRGLKDKVMIVPLILENERDELKLLQDQEDQCDRMGLESMVEEKLVSLQEAKSVFKDKLEAICKRDSSFTDNENNFYDNVLKTGKDWFKGKKTWCEAGTLDLLWEDDRGKAGIRCREIREGSSEWFIMFGKKISDD